VGAQGVAQFMPRTAKEYGLNNPFEPIQALHAAGRFLGRLLSQFGNLGLAAAAYNAGPGRVSDFMTKRRKLPDETKNYVERITGRSADRWTSRTFAHAPEAQVMPVKAPCTEAVEAAAAAQARAAQQAKLAAAAAAAKARDTKQARQDESRGSKAHAVRTALASGKGKRDSAAKKGAPLKLAARASDKSVTHSNRRESRASAKDRAPQKRTHVASAR
jgi:membrane-bound lytic murein transglycosylase MltF